MKAISISAPGGPEVLKFVDVADPAPNDGEVTIDVAFAGVGLVDTIFRRGTFPLPMPLIPGIEVAGHVRAVGQGVEHLRVGQPVAAFLNDFVNLPGCGGYAEIARARADLAVPLDQRSDLTQAATVLVNGTTAQMAIHDIARVTSKDRVMVLGATGGLGGSIGHLARREHMPELIGVVGNLTKREAAQKLGYTRVWLHSELPEALKQFSQDGVDVVFDTVGGDARRVAFEHLAPLGRLVILGNASSADVTLSSDQIWLGTKTVSGLSVGGIAHLVPQRITAAASAVLTWAKNGELDAKPAMMLPLRDAEKAHRLLEERKVTGKIVLRVRD